MAMGMKDDTVTIETVLPIEETWLEASIYP